MNFKCKQHVHFSTAYTMRVLFILFLRRWTPHRWVRTIAYRPYHRASGICCMMYIASGNTSLYSINLVIYVVHRYTASQKYRSTLLHTYVQGGAKVVGQRIQLIVLLVQAQFFWSQNIPNSLV